MPLKFDSPSSQDALTQAPMVAYAQFNITGDIALSVLEPTKNRKDESMDPITAAIVAALAVGATSGLTETARQAVSDAYTALKGLLTRKLGADSKAVRAISDLEDEPGSAAYRAVVQEQLTKTGATQDGELVAAAQALLERVKSQPGGQQILTVSGSGAAATMGGVAAGQGGIAVGGNIQGGVWRPLNAEESQQQPPSK